MHQVLEEQEGASTHSNLSGPNKAPQLEDSRVLHLKTSSKNLSHSFQWEAPDKNNKLRDEHVAKMSTLLLKWTSWKQ